MAIIDQFKKSNLSLDGSRNLSSRTFGYVDAASTVDKLHNKYSIYTDPKVKLVDFNGSSAVRAESTLDELDPIAPVNSAATQYKSSTGRRYKDLGPGEGRY
jgi:hypothetical protein